MMLGDRKPAVGDVLDGVDGGVTIAAVVVRRRVMKGGYVMTKEK